MYTSLCPRLQLLLISHMFFQSDLTTWRLFMDVNTIFQLLSQWRQVCDSTDCRWSSDALLLMEPVMVFYSCPEVLCLPNTVPLSVFTSKHAILLQSSHASEKWQSDRYCVKKCFWKLFTRDSLNDEHELGYFPASQICELDRFVHFKQAEAMKEIVTKNHIDQAPSTLIWW